MTLSSMAKSTVLTQAGTAGLLQLQFTHEHDDPSILRSMWGAGPAPHSNTTLNSPFLRRLARDPKPVGFESPESVVIQSSEVAARAQRSGVRVLLLRLQLLLGGRSCC